MKYDFLLAANEILELHGVKLPLTSQATTSEKTRFEEGLTKQVELFGEGMAKRQTDGPVLRRNINRWLADNCFGDYYTRNGLNDQEREMITFCFLLAQGVCVMHCPPLFLSRGLTRLLNIGSSIGTLI